MIRLLFTLIKVKIQRLFLLKPRTQSEPSLPLFIETMTLSEFDLPAHPAQQPSKKRTYNRKKPFAPLRDKNGRFVSK
jgi:hypothetical protein